MQHVPDRTQGLSDFSQWAGLPCIDKRVNSYQPVKRIMDISITLIALIILFPLMGVIALLIKLDSRGPVIFVQQRVGSRRVLNNGKVEWLVVPFSFYKFRTMWADADQKLHQDYVDAYMDGDESRMKDIQPEADTAPSYKLNHDPRITRIGRFLRASSIDELPQLWNVLIGDMSLVGPRPPLVYEAVKYRREHRQRLATMPGITGWWQVNGRCETTFEEMIQLDMDYIHKQSLWLDLKILLLTVPAILSQRGAG